MSAMAEAEKPADHMDDKQRVYAIFAASSGNLVEWFDFYTYAFTALYFAHHFFPSGDRTTELLNTAGVFAAGFLMRPVGGWLFGRIADRYGRKTSMLVSVMMMCAGSLAIACLPTHQSIGVLAPILLVVCRLVQGLSVGGEYGTAATYMSEVAVAGKRGFFASFQYVTLIGGQLLATVVLVILQQTLSEADLREWGWRIPFVLGALAAVVALFLRRTLEETSSKESRSAEGAGTIGSIWRDHRRAFLTVLGYTAGGSLIFYTFTTYMQKYLVNTAGMDAKQASNIMTVALLVYMAMQPLFGALSDVIGRRNSMLLFGALATVATVPLMLWLGETRSSLPAFAMIVTAMAIISLYTSISGLVKAEMFPAEVRAMGVGLSYALGNAIFGGTAEYVALWFKSVGHETWFFFYVAFMCAIAFGASFIMPDARRGGYLQGHGTH
jgi:MHS family alpha-ketoglutarate permease-like MFS transporter